MKAAIVIPARLGSTRLPEKMLLAETGRTLLEHTYRSAQRSQLADEVLIATDDQRIVDAAAQFGVVAQLTRIDHPSGTSRIAEVAARLTEFDVIVNLQGDEPEMAGEVIDATIGLLAANPQAQVSTAACPLRDRVLLDDPSCVKVVLDHAGRALYFSRSPIPFVRQWEAETLQLDPPLFLQHLGIYGFRRTFLLQFADLPSSPLERSESLEQLRVLQAGHSIWVATVAHASKGIDTPEDYRAFADRQRRANQHSRQ